MIWVRKEKKSDYREVERLLYDVTKEENSQIAYRVCRLRGNKEFNKDYTFVAEDNGTIIGFVTLIRAKIKSEGEDVDALFLVGPYIQKKYEGQGVLTNLMQSAIGEAKYLGEKYVFAISKQTNIGGYAFFVVQNDMVQVDGKRVKDLVLLSLKEEKEKIKGELLWPSFFQEVNLEEVEFYYQKLLSQHQTNETRKKKITKGAMYFSLAFLLAAVVIFVLRMKNIVSPQIGLGSIVIAMGACLGSIGTSYMVTDRKPMGIVAFSLSAIVIVLGILTIFN